MRLSSSNNTDSGGWVVVVNMTAYGRSVVFPSLTLLFQFLFQSVFRQGQSVLCKSSLLPLTSSPNLRARSTVHRLTCYQSWEGGQTSFRNEAHTIHENHSLTISRKQTVELSTKSTIKHNSFPSHYWLFVYWNRHLWYKKHIFIEKKFINKYSIVLQFLKRPF